MKNSTVCPGFVVLWPNDHGRLTQQPMGICISFWLCAALSCVRFVSLFIVPVVCPRVSPNLCGSRSLPLGSVVSVEGQVVTTTLNCLDHVSWRYFSKHIPMACVFPQTCPSCGITFAPKSEAGAEGGAVQNGCQDEPKASTKVTSSWLLFLSVPLLAHPPKVTFLSRQLPSSENNSS